MKIWMCAACAKRSHDRYGEDPIDPGWDESCYMNAVEVEEEEAAKAHDEYLAKVKQQQREV